MATNQFQSRLNRLQATLPTHQAVLISNPQDIYYLSGFEALLSEEREGFLLVSAQAVLLFFTSFSPTPSFQWLHKKPQVHPTALTKHLTEFLQQYPEISELLIDESTLYVSEYQALKKLSQLQLSSWDQTQLWEQRWIKDSTEVKALTRASQIASQAVANSIPQLQVGITEFQFQRILEENMEQLGSQRVAFPTIIAFGAHTALPHHQPGTTKLKSNMPVLIDCGATVDHYRSDMTRTIWFGPKTHPQFHQIEQIVKTAYQLALTELQEPETTVASLDKVTREYITQQGFGKEFIHTTGHGVGLGIHEPPSLNWQNQTLIKPGMVITIEPGIYLEDKFGYRYENTILVTKKSGKELTK